MYVKVKNITLKGLLGRKYTSYSVSLINLYYLCSWLYIVYINDVSEQYSIMFCHTINKEYDTLHDT